MVKGGGSGGCGNGMQNNHMDKGNTRKWYLLSSFRNSVRRLCTMHTTVPAIPMSSMRQTMPPIVALTAAMGNEVGEVVVGGGRVKMVGEEVEETKEEEEEEEGEGKGAEVVTSIKGVW